MKLPLVLLGETRSAINLAAIRVLRWGRIFLVRRPTPQPFEQWGFDNGAFTAWIAGRPFPTETFCRRLDEALTVESDPVVAVTPDIVAGGLHSLDFSVAWRPKLPGNWPWYLAVQDGMEVSDVEPALHYFAGIFLGGSDRFKATAYRWARLARKHGLKFHYGRAGTLAKLRAAYNVSADSCDSSFPLWTKDRLRIFSAAWAGLPDQLRIEGALA